MIALHLHDVQSAEAWSMGGVENGVTLRFADGSRCSLYTRTYDQAVAIENAFNSEEDARREPATGAA